AALPRPRGRPSGDARPGHGRPADLRGSGPPDVRVPEAGARRAPGRRDGAVCPERRRRGGRPGLPRRGARLHRHSRGRRARARRSAARADRALLGPLPCGCRREGDRTRARAGRGRVSWVLALAGFSALILLHEFGHFAAAKAVGMRVERFSLFFPPHVLKRKSGETEYALGTIPIGGYVKISGMSPAENLPDDVRDRAYHAQPVWERVGGIARRAEGHVGLPLLVGVLFFTAFGPRDLGVAAIQKGFPAAGTLRQRDVLVAVDGHRGNDRQLADRIAAHRCAQLP